MNALNLTRRQTPSQESVTHPTCTRARKLRAEVEELPAAGHPGHPGHPGQGRPEEAPPPRSMIHGTCPRPYGLGRTGLAEGHGRRPCPSADGEIISFC